MRVLLDECVPKQLKADFGDLDVRTVQEMGWAGVKNSALIDRAGDDFDAIFTVDRDFGSRYRGQLPVGIVILRLGTTDPVKLRPHLASVLEALSRLKRGEVIRVGA